MTRPLPERRQHIGVRNRIDLGVDTLCNRLFAALRRQRVKVDDTASVRDQVPRPTYYFVQRHCRTIDIIAVVRSADRCRRSRGTPIKIGFDAANLAARSTAWPPPHRGPPSLFVWSPSSHLNPLLRLRSDGHGAARATNWKFGASRHGHMLQRHCESLVFMNLVAAQSAGWRVSNFRHTPFCSNTSVDRFDAAKHATRLGVRCPTILV